jgi:hypothetical protein
MEVYAERIDKGEELPDIEITALKGEDIKGDYSLTSFRPWNDWKKEKYHPHYAGFTMHSYESGAHIPRMMIERAVAEIQELADSRNYPIVHIMSLQTIYSQKMEKLLTELGYEKKNGNFEKTPIPKAF